MTSPKQTLVDLETRFWQSMVDTDPDTATRLLHEPAVMVSAHGALQFDHASYRKMAEQGTRILTSFKLDDMNVLFANDDVAVLTYRVTQGVARRGQGGGHGKEDVEVMNDSSTWIRTDGQWKCVMHTETPVNA